ncbi:ankyrin repeat-containing protein BDA1 [Ziziphus jujuba]|uniref:Ankyrin repeat-containing protein BDA1 n=1 Tax=Ziziphus jujuba TaxID=326968 RepID=A0A6P3ZV95_ZIZJJ|nr:ankyrin repeat-containing protein BDA1 [Ziziphus jujuba]
MEENLKTAAQNGDINKIYKLLGEDPNVLDCIDDVPFIDTPLHIAASFGHVQFAREIMRLKPSFARKLNQDGFSPMHLALQNGQTKMVLGFLNCESDLARVQGREGKTSLHYVAEQGEVDLLTEFLSACPQSIQDVTIQNETALHIAVKNSHVDALDFLLGGLRRACYRGSDIQERKIINWKDDEGNTVLHIATAMNQSQAVRLLISSKIKVNVKNLMGLTALDLSDPNSGQVRETLLNAGALNAQSLPQVSNDSRDHLRSSLSCKESTAISISRFKKNTSNDTRSVFLVVAVLIITATFQVGLTPPAHVFLDLNFDNSNNNNALDVTLVNTTSRINTTEIQLSKNEGSSKADQLRTLIAFMLSYSDTMLNSATFFSAIMALYSLLPDGEVNKMLSLPLFSFALCFMSFSLYSNPVLVILLFLLLPLSDRVFNIWVIDWLKIFNSFRKTRGQIQ